MQSGSISLHTQFTNCVGYWSHLPNEKQSLRLQFCFHRPSVLSGCPVSGIGMEVFREFNATDTIGKIFAMYMKTSSFRILKIILKIIYSNRSISEVKLLNTICFRWRLFTKFHHTVITWWSFFISHAQWCLYAHWSGEQQLNSKDVTLSGKGTMGIWCCYLFKKWCTNIKSADLRNGAWIKQYN
jgi:hypothetical protein